MPILAMLACTAFAQSPPVVVPLWPKGAPGFESRRDEPEQAKDWWVKNIHNPTITAFLPAKDRATGAAVLIFPGGGHRELVFDAEGRDAAEFLRGIGVAAFVLKYRLAREENSPYQLGVHARDDAYRAMRLIRSRAEDWGVDPNRVGTLGFSAGGEVAAWIAYDSGAGDASAADPVDRLAGKPNFQMLVYPGPLGIPASIPADAPPTFAVVANDDGLAGVVVSLLGRYRSAKVPIEAHVYAQGNHAFNMGQRTKLASVKGWPQRMADWLGDSGYLKKSGSSASE